MKRCAWAEDGNELMKHYHDHEWGIPVHDDRLLFEYFVLDAFQAGLSWSTVLNKRENFRKAFSNFDAKKIIRYTEKDVERLMQDAGIIRNRMKIEATINNAWEFLRIQKEYGSFDKFIWQFTDGETVVNAWSSWKDVPAKTPLSDQMSKTLKKEGFKFVGSTICYAFMQAAGMVDDHALDCFKRAKN